MALSTAPGSWRGFLEQVTGSRMQVGFEDDTEPPSQPMNTDEHAVPFPPTQTVLFMTLDELLLPSGRSSLPTLDPQRKNGAGWFEFTKGITKTIKNIMENDYKVAAPNWTSLSGETKLRWFKAFAQKYNWDYSHTTLVRENFDCLCATRLLDRVYEWKLLWRNNEDDPTWMNDMAWNGLITYWTAQKNAARSMTNSNNRNSDRGGYGISKHSCGSCPYRRMRENMRDAVTGELPDMVTFMEKTHKRKADGVFIDKKAEHIVRRCREIEQTKLTQMTEAGDSCGDMQLTDSQLNAIYSSEVQVKKGYRFGTGKLAIEDEATPSPPKQTLDYETMYHATQTKLQEATSQISALSAQVKDAVYWSSVMRNMFPDRIPPSAAPYGNNQSEFSAF